MHLIKLLSFTRILFLVVPRIIRSRMMRIVPVLEPALMFSVVFLRNNNYGAGSHYACIERKNNREKDQLFHDNVF